MSRIKGGREILGLVPGPKTDVELKINCTLSPASNYLSNASTANPPVTPRWNTSAIELPKIPVSVQGDKIKIWELWKVRTGPVGYHSNTPVNPSAPNTGPNCNKWSASGLPMSMIKGQASGLPPISENGLVIVPLDANNSPNFTLNSVDFNPFVENAKYYSRESRAGASASGDNNSTVVLCADEQGWGIMCPNGEVFLSSLDCNAHVVAAAGANTRETFNYYINGRYFTLWFRQRFVKSPVMLSDLFEQYTRQQIGSYSGEVGNVEGVTMQFGPSKGPQGMLQNAGVRDPPRPVPPALAALPKVVETPVPVVHLK